MYRDYRYIENYPGYIISNFGEVFSIKGKKVRQLKSSPNNNGYLMLTLSKNNKHTTHSIHALVGNAFIGLRTGGLTFDHIDRIKINNRADNIRLATNSEQNLNKAIQKRNKSGFQNICEYKRNGTEFYKLEIIRNKKLIVDRRFKISDYTIEDVAKIRDDIIAKYNHEVCLNKVHIELLHVRNLVRSV
tara:strand:- start:34 stop:597 length:564 start_codon:yes stop_codon:yes gene_type:complete